MADLVVPSHASYSSIDSYMSCGERYRLTRIEKIPENPAWWSIGGSAVHQATEMFDLGLQQPVPAAELFEEAFALQLEKAQHFDQVTDPKDYKCSRGQAEEWWMDNGPGMVQSWIDWRAATQWQILEVVDQATGECYEGVETPINIEVGGMAVKGYIDRVFVDGDGQVVIVDLKSGARRPDSAMQLGFYRVGLMLQYGVTADVGGYWMARKKPEEQFIPMGLERYTEEFVARFVAGFKYATDSGMYLPHVTSFCKSCGVAAHCWAQK